MWSIHWRGTDAAPGLVLALDAEEGVSCEGMALRIAPGEEDKVLTMIRARELVSDAYEERLLPVTLANGVHVEALVYVIRRGHAQHAMLDPEAQARIVARARGARGANLDYLAGTVDHLASAGIPDHGLEAILAQARVFAAEGHEPME